MTEIFKKIKKIAENIDEKEYNKSKKIIIEISDNSIVNIKADFDVIIINHHSDFFNEVSHNINNNISKEEMKKNIEGLVFCDPEKTLILEQSAIIKYLASCSKEIQIKSQVMTYYNEHELEYIQKEVEYEDADLNKYEEIYTLVNLFKIPYENMNEWIEQLSEYYSKKLIREAFEEQSAIIQDYKLTIKSFEELFK